MKKSSKKFEKYPYKTSDVFVTQGMLYGVRDELKAEIRSSEAGTNARLEKVTSEIHRLGVLVEEQNGRNNVVLDGLTNLFHRQERTENEVTQLRKVMSGLK